ncbi:MAG: 3'-5' exonuclease, partial [Candidatus Micrarchaeia archaeon]
MYLFFDTETTGLPQRWNADFSDVDNWPRMVQLGFLVYDDAGKLKESADLIIKPEGFTIPEEVVKIHGISTERALAEGIALAEALDRFVDVLDEAHTLVAHNIDFDQKILGAELYRLGLHADIETLKEIDKICTMKAATNYCAIPKPGYGQGYKWPTLAQLHWKLFAKEFAGSHSAYTDAEACAKCFFKLKEMQE